MVGDRVAEVLIEQGGEFAPRLHLFRPPGRLRRGACANLRIIAARRASSTAVRDDARPVSCSERWRELAEHPLVGEARSVGLIGALELVRDKATRAASSTSAAKSARSAATSASSNGLIMRAVRDTMIVSPPLVITPRRSTSWSRRRWRCLDLTLAALPAPTGRALVSHTRGGRAGDLAL